MKRTNEAVLVDTGEVVKIVGVHPVADLFPMLADDELDELAADMATRGQLQPIVLFATSQPAEFEVGDGRNRWEAASRAGIKPTAVIYTGDDPGGYALATNIHRRHMTKGQQAMVIARACSVSEQTVRAAAEQHGASVARIGTANTVLSHAPDLADAVLSGATSLDSAYDVARKRKNAANDIDAQMERLRVDHPDFADLVIEERMTLAEAVAAGNERDRKLAEERRDARALLDRIIGLVPTAEHTAAWSDHLGDVDPQSAQSLALAIASLTALAERISQ